MTQAMARPTKDPKDTTLQMRVSEAFLKSIDSWRRKQDDLPSRSEAIRRLVELALKVKQK
jgi:Arc/MetJ-type ribon-helix-helix transcriptional regulator